MPKKKEPAKGSKPKATASGKKTAASSRTASPAKSPGQKAADHGVLQDTPECKKVEEAESSQRRNEDRLSRAQVISHVGDWEWDLATNAVHWSDELYRIYGFEPRSVAPDYGLVLAQMHPESKDVFLKAIDAALKEDRHFEMDYRFFRKDGSAAMLHTIGQIIRDASGAPVRMLGIVQDITERTDAERMLRESEDRFRSIFEQATDGIMIADPAQKRNIEANQAICAMLGYTRDELSALSVEEMHPKKDLQRVLDLFERQVRGEISMAPDVPLVRKDGSVVYADINATPVVIGGRQCLIGVFRDITERKLAEEKLSEKNTMLQTLLHAIPDQVFFKDSKGRFLLVNKAMEETCGLGQDALAGMTDDELSPPDVAEKCKKSDAEAIKRGRPVSSDEYYTDKNGETRFLDVVKAPIFDNKGDLTGLVVVSRDITERKEAEEKIRQNEEFIRSILDTVDEGFIVIDKDYRILTANKAYCGQAALPCEEVIGRHCYEISHNNSRPCYEEGEECAVRQVFATGKPHAVLHRHRDHEGHVLYVETKGFPIKDTEGNVTSVIETVNNITEKHLLEEERLKTQKLESIGTLAGGIAHDFNNLLQGIFGYISMAIMTYDQKEKSLAMLEQAEKALHQSVNLTTQLLTFSKGGKPVKKPLSLEPVIENAVKFALSGSRTEYQLNIDHGLWQVNGDAGQLGQVIQNIVLNADQAMPKGGVVKIAARNVAADDRSLPSTLAQDNYVVLTIEDNGVGIPEGYLNKIFDPYFTTKDKGSGLGLATSYSIIRNHAGEILVTSAAGKGSLFTLYIPATTARSVVETTGWTSPAGAPKGRILVMDDEELIRSLARELLRALGHEVEVAAHGEAALAKYQEAARAGRPFDIVILDLTIRGGMGGAETVKKLREFAPNVKAIMSSGYSDDAVTADYREQGFTEVLKKPYDIAELNKILHTLLT